MLEFMTPAIRKRLNKEKRQRQQKRYQFEALERQRAFREERKASGLPEDIFIMKKLLGV